MEKEGTEALKYVWKGAIPLQIHLHDSEVTTLPSPPPVLVCYSSSFFIFIIIIIDFFFIGVLCFGVLSCCLLLQSYKYDEMN